MVRIAVLVAGLPMMTLAAGAHAQGTLRDQAREIEQPGRVISINPFLPLGGYFQGEFEQRVRPNISFALSVASTKMEDCYRSGDGKIRMYPAERALTGLGVAVGLGYGSVRHSSANGDQGGRDCSRGGKTESAPTFAVEGQYQWLMGESRATAITTGFGLKRYFIPDSRSDGIRRIVPTLRLTIGYAF